MIFAATRSKALQTRFSRSTPDGRRVWRSMFFGPAPSPESSASLAGAASDRTYADPVAGEIREPQAFLVEQEPGAVVQPHFHYVDQFQVVVAGSGSLGRHPVAPIGVHFAGACTGYGPIQPGAAGLSYFTFRASADETGAQYLPAARERMRAVARRNVVIDAIAPSGGQALAARTASAVESLLEGEDGLGVFMVRIAPSGTVMSPDAALGNGVSMLVVGGEIVQGGVRYAEWSCLYAGAQELAVTLQAGAGGAEVLVMRYPRTLSPTG